MSERTEKARQLRLSKEPHYNCCQSVIIPFCDVCNIDEETAYKLGANFGGGMRIGSVCGAITGGLMVLGLLNRNEKEVMNFLVDFQTENETVNCSQLLLKVNENCPQAQLCNGFVVSCVKFIEEVITS